MSHVKPDQDTMMPPYPLGTQMPCPPSAPTKVKRAVAPHPRAKVQREPERDDETWSVQAEQRPPDDS